MKTLNDLILKTCVAMQTQNPFRHRRITYLVMLLLMMSMPALAQPSVTDNVITRFAWFVAQLAFYGVGSVVVLMGIVIPIGKKALGQRTETNPVVNILWAVGLFAAPSLLTLGLEFFNNDLGGAGFLDDMEVNFGGDE